jgi:hypothetical protein
MGLQSFERGLERMVEGVFARAFRSSLRPIELGRRLVREMDDHRSVDVKGRTIVPNDFSFRLAPADLDNFHDIEDALVRELADAAREHSRDEGYVFMGPVHVELVEDPAIKPGRLLLGSRMLEATGGGPAGALVLSNATRVPLSDNTVSIGRLPECDVTLSDPNVSRRHAEVRPSGNGFVIVDLRSTNGTTVNGIQVTEHVLADGDEIGIGSSRLRFEAS